MKVDKNTKLPVGIMGGSLHSWERGIDPWHKDTFKGVPVNADFAHQGERSEGWFGLDAWGNDITFIADGTEVDL